MQNPRIRLSEDPSKIIPYHNLKEIELHYRSYKKGYLLFIFLQKKSFYTKGGSKKKSKRRKFIFYFLYF